MSRSPDGAQDPRPQSGPPTGGCRETPGKGSHTKWFHPALPRPVVLAGHDGDDAQAYQEAAVRQALARIAAAQRRSP